MSDDSKKIDTINKIAHKLVNIWSELDKMFLELDTALTPATADSCEMTPDEDIRRHFSGILMDINQLGLMLIAMKKGDKYVMSIDSDR